MTDAVVSVVAAGSRCADCKNLEFERNESAFDTCTNPAAGLPVVHVEELLGLVTFIQREVVLSFDRECLQVVP